MAFEISAKDQKEAENRMRQFLKLSPEERVRGRVPAMNTFLFEECCTPEWREKVTNVVREGRSASRELINEMSAHTGCFELDLPPDAKICTACRSVFWKIIFVNTDGDH